MNPLRIHIFAHSFVSDWSHSSAHFLRGLARELMALGHSVRCHEELGSWSLVNLVRHEQERSIDAIDDFRRRFRGLDIQFYERGAGLREHLRAELRGADVVLVQEWNEPDAVNTLLGLKAELGFRAFFLDTHHRAYTRAGEMLRFHLHLFDAVLAGGEPLRRIYADGFGLRRVWTFHEGADTGQFTPQAAEPKSDLLWIGNWGGAERTAELNEFLLEPSRALPDLQVWAYGVRYPDEAVAWMREAGVDHRGYLPDLDAPQAYAASRLAVHLPRKPYTNGLSGMPSLRLFTALACGAALLCAPWEDNQGLFRPGQDFLVAHDGAGMTALITELLRDDHARRQLAEHGLHTVRTRHTCRHRAEEFIAICHDARARAA